MHTQTVQCILCLGHDTPQTPRRSPLANAHGVYAHGTKHTVFSATTPNKHREGRPPTPRRSPLANAAGAKHVVFSTTISCKHREGRRSQAQMARNIATARRGRCKGRHFRPEFRGRSTRGRDFCETRWLPPALPPCLKTY